MHGIEAVRNDDGRYWVMFSASALPPTGADSNGSWPHDVYVSAWGAGDGDLSPAKFISRPEAQEPVSIARTKNGHIMVTFEDGYDAPNLLVQRYGVYDAALAPIKPYPNDVADGGHSGHVAATDGNFIVFYSEDWVEHGGVDDLGTGKGVYVAVYDSDGGNRRAVPVAPKVREWWPVLAASPAKVLLLWQQYIPGKRCANLRMAVLDPAAGRLTVAPKNLKAGIQYYVYQTAYVRSLDQFLVAGTTYEGEGFAYLINTSGEITASLTNLPATVREGGIAVEGNSAYLAAGNDGLIQLSLTPRSITLKAARTAPFAWSYIGNLGLLRGGSKIHWVSLSQTGLQEVDFDFSDAATAPVPASAVMSNNVGVSDNNTVPSPLAASLETSLSNHTLWHTGATSPGTPPIY
jgi:hypothetical protein